ncbi:chondroitin proteoglycan 2-like, partial [Brachionus plicatilis]
ILVIVKLTFRVNKSACKAFSINTSERHSRPFYNKRFEKRSSNEYLENSYPTIYDNIYYSRCNSMIDLTRMPNSCRSFRRCVKGSLFIMRCPYGTVFDEELKVCNFPSNISGYCGNSNGCDPDRDLTIVPGFIDRFFRCTNGILYILKCPNTLIFSIQKKQCIPSTINYF